jgi:ribulose-phosphate 3-epimerase
MITKAGLGDVVNVEVDGGINATTVSGAAASGANVLIAGSALYKHPGGLKAAVDELRTNATSAFRA